MRVFGIDCGTEITGYGVVETCDTERRPRLLCIALGEIRLAKTKSLPVRLEQVYRELMEELGRWRPDAVAIEEVFYSVNAKSALKLGQVRGVALLAAASRACRLPSTRRCGSSRASWDTGSPERNRCNSWWRGCSRCPQVPQPAGRGRRAGDRHLSHPYRADAVACRGQCR